MSSLVTTWTNGNVKITLDLTELDKLAKEAPKRVDRIIKKVAFAAEGYMKQRAAIDTSAMANSIYTVVGDFDGYAAAAAAAKEKNPNVETASFPNPPEHAAFVGPCVDYAIYQEFGTYRMAAHPFVHPGALKAAMQDLPKLVPELFE